MNTPNELLDKFTKVMRKQNKKYPELRMGLITATQGIGKSRIPVVKNRFNPDIVVVDYIAKIK